MVGRQNKSGALLGAAEGHPISGMFAACGVLSRWSLDIIVWATGNPRLAGHRFQDVSDEVEAEWVPLLRHLLANDREG